MRIAALLVTLAFGCQAADNSTGEGREPGECSDGADNDGNGLFDCNDPGCHGAPACEGGGADAGHPGDGASGIKWKAQSSGVSKFLTAITGCGGNMWAVGEDGTILSTTDGGVTWIAATSHTTNSLFGVWCDQAGPLIAVGVSGTILRSFNSSAGAGLNWIVATSGTSAWLRGVWGSSYNDIFAAGHQGTVLHSINGSTWAPVTTTFDSSIDFHGVFGLAPTFGTLVGMKDQGPVIYSQTGVSTNFTPEPAAGTSFLYNVGGSTYGEMIAVGDHGTILQKVSTWKRVTSGTTHFLRGVWVTGDTAIAVGEGGTILRSVDGGETWTAEASGTTEVLYAAWGTSPTNVYIVGASGTILHYTP